MKELPSSLHILQDNHMLNDPFSATNLNRESLLAQFSLSGFQPSCTSTPPQNLWRKLGAVHTNKHLNLSVFVFFLLKRSKQAATVSLEQTTVVHKQQRQHTSTNTKR